MQKQGQALSKWGLYAITADAAGSRPTRSRAKGSAVNQSINYYYYYQTKPSKQNGATDKTKRQNWVELQEVSTDINFVFCSFISHLTQLANLQYEHFILLEGQNILADGRGGLISAHTWRYGAVCRLYCPLRLELASLSISSPDIYIHKYKCVWTASFLPFRVRFGSNNPIDGEVAVFYFYFLAFNCWGEEGYSFCNTEFLCGDKKKKNKAPASTLYFSIGDWRVFVHTISDDSFLIPAVRKKKKISSTVGGYMKNKCT